MATPELRELREKYEAASAAYQRCVTTLSDASRNGKQPTAELSHNEERAFRDLARLRQALTDALFEHTSKKSA